MKYYGECAASGVVSGEVTTSVGGRGILLLDFLNPNFILSQEKIKGLILRRGGLLCHGAVLAREYNIPCLVNTKISKISGRVELNATEGYVKTI